MNKDSETIIHKYLPEFKEWRKSKEYQEFMDEANIRIKRFRELLSPDNIDKLGEDGVKEILTSLWAVTDSLRHRSPRRVKKIVQASQVKGSKDKLFQIFLDANGNDINKIRMNIKELIHGNRPLAERYDNFRTNVDGGGSTTITGILTFYYPSRYCLWNEWVRKAADLLNLSRELYSNKQQIDGKEYEHVMDVLKQIKDILEKEGLGSSYLDVTLFMYFLSGKDDAYRKERDVKVKGDRKHDDIIEMLLQIGNTLGFDVQREVQIAKGSRVDVVWSARIGNLGSIKYLFEVQVGGSIDSLLLNLQKAMYDRTAQRLVVVADMETLEKVREEAEPLSSDFKKRLVYLDVNDVIHAKEMLENAMQRLSKLLIE
ncbi:MAG: hypothetical protein QXY85_08080 [Candidatus Nitrosocaldus sp.]